MHSLSHPLCHETRRYVPTGVTLLLLMRRPWCERPSVASAQLSGDGRVWELAWWPGRRNRTRPLILWNPVNGLIRFHISVIHHGQNVFQWIGWVKPCVRAFWVDRVSRWKREIIIFFCVIRTSCNPIVDFFVDFGV